MNPIFSLCWPLSYCTNNLTHSLTLAHTHTHTHPHPHPHTHTHTNTHTHPHTPTHTHTHLEVTDIVGLADTAAVITISSSRKCPSATRPGGRGIEHTYSASAKPLIHSMGTLRLIGHTEHWEIV